MADLNAVGFALGAAVGLGDGIRRGGIQHKLSHGRLDVVEAVLVAKGGGIGVDLVLGGYAFIDVMLVKLGNGLSESDGFWLMVEGTDVGAVVGGEVQEMSPRIGR